VAFAVTPNSKPGGKNSRAQGIPPTVETHRLKLAARAGVGGRGIAGRRAPSWTRCCGICGNGALSLSAQAQKEFPPLALVAIGRLTAAQS